MRHGTIAIVFTCCSALMPAAAGAQVLAGRVLEAGSDRPIPAARVSLTSDVSGVVEFDTDSVGLFRFALLQSGEYAVRVEHLGYATAHTEPIPVGRDETVDITIRMSVSAVPLAPVMVVERRRIIPRTEFERRAESGRQTGRGRFITRDEVERSPSPAVTDVLARVPQVGTVYDSAGKPHPFMLSRGGCTPTLYINGMRLTLTTGEGIDDVILPHELEGIEVYRNHMELPSELLDGCGAIVFWTHAGRPTQGRSWRFLAGAGVVLGMAVFVVLF